MAQGNVDQESGHNYTTNDTKLKYRTTNSGNPLAHDSVDANFDILRTAVNGIVSDVSGVAGKTVGTNVPVNAVFTDTAYTHPNHSGDVTSVGDGATTITAGAVTSTKIATGAVTSTQIATGAVTNTKIANNAVTEVNIASGAVTTTKIADNSITTTQLVTEGSNSISLTQVVPKTLVIHVGNYYDRDGTQQLASDAFNYNSSNDTYGLRAVKTINFSDAPNGWFGYHYDSEAAETVESFATVIAAIRYALHNFGAGAYLNVVVHGHVSWFGEYDMLQTTGDRIKDALHMDMFSGFALTGGAPGTYSGSDSAETVYPYVTARCDIDCNGRGLLAPGFWHRGPRLMWAGVNLVFRKSTGATNDIELWQSGSNVGFHEIRGMRFASIDQPSGAYFQPLSFNSKSEAYVSSGSNQPLEFFISRNSTPFRLWGNSNLLISNNATSNDHYFESQHGTMGVRWSGIWGKVTNSPQESAMLHQERAFL